MRVVTWNCNMALHKKCEPLMELRPDIAVIQECADVTGVTAHKSMMPYTNHHWIGHSKNKGLGVFSFGDFRIERHRSFSSDFHLFLPAVVDGPAHLHLLAVWAYNHRVPSAHLGGSGKPCDACDHYRAFLASNMAMVVGDFNNNDIWDTPGNPYNHSRTVTTLSELGFRSTYHSWFQESFGKEKQATFYFYRHRTKPYHIDYAFLKDRQIAALKRVELGNPEQWLQYSDHVPLVLDLNVVKETVEENRSGPLSL